MSVVNMTNGDEVDIDGSYLTFKVYNELVVSNANGITRTFEEITDAVLDCA